MVRQHDASESNEADPRDARRSCRIMLDRLEQNRRASAARRAETGTVDPLQVITGSSALDSAVASTRAMIRELDTLIDELEGLTADGPTAGSERARERGRTIPLDGRAEIGLAAVQSAANR